MKILYHHRTQAEDGQAVHIRALIEAFQSEGHEVREAALVARTDAGGASSPPPTGAQTDSSARSRWGWVARAPRFVRELAEYAYTVPARGRLLREARDFEPDFVYERYAFGNAAGVDAAERLGLPIVVEVNSPMALELGKTRGLAFPRLAERVERSILRRASRVCAVTQVLADMLAEMGVARERLFVTPNGVDLDRYRAPDRAAARRALSLESDGPVLGFVGYYRDWHRLDLLIEGLTERRLADAQLVLIGGGPVEDELRAAAVRLGVGSRVHFAGARGHAEIPALLPAFDVALLPAINPYASPLKLFEYMAAGRAIVAPDQPNLREVLTDGVDSLLVPPGDGAALVDATAALVADADLRVRLGASAAGRIVEQDLTWRGNARRVVDAVKRAAEEAA